MCQNGTYHSNLEYGFESWWSLLSWFMAWTPIFLVDMDSLIPLVIQMSSFMRRLTLPKSMVWLVCATWSMHTDGYTPVSKSSFLSPFCALSLVSQTSCMSPQCRSLDSLCMGSGTPHLPCLSVHACPSCVPASSSESGGASWLSQHHGSGICSSMPRTGPLRRGWWQRCSAYSKLLQ